MAASKRQELRHGRERRIREELREKLKGLEYLRQIENDVKTLGEMSKKVAELKATKIKTKKDNDLDLYAAARFDLEKISAQRAILKLKLNTNFRRLKFILPELRAIELTDGEGNNPLAQFVEMLIQATKDNV